MNKQFALLVVLSVSVIGCSTGSVTSSSTSVRPPGKPGYLRFINLTSESADVKVDGTQLATGIAQGKLSIGYITSPKSHNLTGIAGSTIEPLTFKAEPGVFETIVVKKSGGKTVFEIVKGESMTAPDSGTNFEYINMTDQKVSFSNKSEKLSVDPMKSGMSSGSEGSQSVEVGGFGKVEFKTETKEIWGVCAVKVDGKLTAHSVRLKGPLKATLGGASSLGG